VCEFKRVDEEEGDGGKLEVEWWKKPKPKGELQNLELLKLKKVVFTRSVRRASLVYILTFLSAAAVRPTTCPWYCQSLWS
jgi:hypothetical protein